MLGQSKNQHHGAPSQTHPAESGVGQHATTGDMRVWRMTSPRHEAAMNARILEQRNRFIPNKTIKATRDGEAIPGFGLNQNLLYRTSHGENCDTLSVTRAERFDDPRTGHQLIDDKNGPDNPVKSVNSFETNPTEDDPETGYYSCNDEDWPANPVKSVNQSKTQNPVMDDPVMGPEQVFKVRPVNPVKSVNRMEKLEALRDDPTMGLASLGGIGGPPSLLLTDSNKNEARKTDSTSATQSRKDGQEAGKPSQFKATAMSRFDEKMEALKRSILSNEAFTSPLFISNPFINTKPQLVQNGLKALDERHGLYDFNQGCCFPYDQRRSGLGAPARNHCTNDPSRGDNQGSIGRYGTDDQSMENLATDDSKPKGGEMGRIYMMSLPKPNIGSTSDEAFKLTLSVPKRTVERMMLDKLNNNETKSPTGGRGDCNFVSRSTPAQVKDEVPKNSIVTGSTSGEGTPKTKIVTGSTINLDASHTSKARESFDDRMDQLRKVIEGMNAKVNDNNERLKGIEALLIADGSPRSINDGNGRSVNPSNSDTAESSIKTQVKPNQDEVENPEVDEDDHSKVDSDSDESFFYDGKQLPNDENPDKMILMDVIEEIFSADSLPSGTKMWQRNTLTRCFLTKTQSLTSRRREMRSITGHK